MKVGIVFVRFPGPIWMVWHRTRQATSRYWHLELLRRDCWRKSMSKQVLELLRAISFIEKDNSVSKLAAIPQDEIAKRLAYFYQSRKDGSKHELTKLFQAELNNSALISSLSAANEV